MKVLKVLGKILAFVLSVFVYFVSVLMIVYISINRFVSSDNLKELLNTSNVLTFELDDGKIEDKIINFFEGYNISKKNTSAIISSYEFTSLMDEYIDDAIDYYLLDKDYPELDSSKYESLLDLIISKNMILNESQEEIKKELISKKVEIENLLPDKNELLKGSDYEKIINIYSNISIFYFIGSIIIFMFLIFIFTYSLYKPFVYIGISLIFSSLLFLIFRLFLRWDYSDIILSNFLNQFLISSLMVLGVGIAFVIIYAIINNMKKEAK